MDFGWVWGGFWEGFGRGVATFLASLGALFSPWGVVKYMFFPMEGPRDGQEASWTRFGVDLEGFWEGSGSLLDVKIDLFLVFAARIAQDNMKQHKIA